MTQTNTGLDYSELNKLMASRTRRRNEAIADCIAAHGDDEFSDFAPAYANLVDGVLATVPGEIPWMIEYVERFTRDCPDDRERLRSNLTAFLAAL